MTPRPRTVTDDDILAATARAIGRCGPVDLTLADVARDVGVSPATLVQRFGSKRNLLLALVRTGPAGAEQCFARARAAPGSALAGLLAALASVAREIGRPEEIANHLAFLQIDLSDPDFHRLAQEQARVTTRHVERLLQEAVDAGEIAGAEVRQLARTLQEVMSGALLSWAILRTGPPEAWLRRELEAVVAPYRVRAQKKARPAPRAAKTGKPRRARRSARRRAASR